MSTQLRNILCQVKVENGKFCSNRDEHGAMEICKWNSLHSMLETANLFNQVSGEKLGSNNEKYLCILTVFITTAPDKWIQEYVNGFGDENTCSLCINSIRAIAKCADVHSLYDECDAGENSYEDTAKIVCIVLGLLQVLFKRVILCDKMDECADPGISVTHVAFFLFIISVQHLEARTWTTPSSRKVASECIQLIEETFASKSMEDFLLKNLKHPSPVQESEFNSLEKKCVVGKILLLWKPFFSRKQWKHYPTVASGFHHCLLQLKFPNISPFIELVLPPSLLFVDDHLVDNKEMGLECLIHILRNTGAEELRWYGRADVIYEALKLQLHCTEDALLKKAHEALLLILKVIVKDAQKLNVRTKYDDIFCLILQAAYQENKIALRRVHTGDIGDFIQQIGINIVKYLKELLDLFEEYLEVEDAPNEKARLNVLCALKTLITVAWPRMSAHCMRILKFLVKFIHQLTSQNPKTSEAIETELLLLAEECLRLLCGLDSQKMQQYVKVLNCQSFLFSNKCKAILQNIEKEL